MGLKAEIEGLGFFQGLGFTVEGSGLRVLGIKVWGSLVAGSETGAPGPQTLNQLQMLRHALLPRLSNT